IGKFPSTSLAMNKAWQAATSEDDIMPPTDDSADDHLPVVNGATPSNDDAGRLALPTWFTTQGDLGPDFVLHRDGQTEVSHCKWSGHGRSRLEHYVFFPRH